MSNRIRYQNPEFIYHITNRTLFRQFLFVPTALFTYWVKLYLKQAARIYGVKIYGVVVMSNHYHLLASAPRGNMERFMGHWQQRISAKLHTILGRPRGPAFSGRYKMEPILDDASLLGKLEYILTNPVRAQLVRHPRAWPGYTSWHQNCGEGDESAPEITPLPHLAHLSPDESKKWMERLVRKTCRANHHRKFMGAERCKRQKWSNSPKTKDKRKGRPLCHTTSKKTWIRYAKFAQRKSIRHRRCSQLTALGENVRFPRGTIPPGRRRDESQFRAESRLLDRQWCLARPRPRHVYEETLDRYLEELEAA